MDIDEKPIKTHYRVTKENVKNQIKSYPRCYYIPLNNDSTKISIVTDSKKLDNTDKEKFLKEKNLDLNFTTDSIKKIGKINTLDKKKYKQELKEHKSKEEKRIKKVVANVNLSSNSDEEIDDNKNSIDFKKEYNNENNRSMIPILSDDTISTSPNLIDNFKDNRNKNFEFSNESNSDWSNYNYSSSNITLKSNLNEEDAIKRNKELSKSLESLFDEEIKFNPPISKDKELKKKNKEKQLEKVLKDSKYIENDEGDNDSIHKHENNYSFSKNKFSKTKLKHVIDDDKHDNLENNKNKSKPNQNIKKEFEKEKEENIFKKKKLKKEKIIGKTESDNKNTEYDIKNTDNEEKDKRLLQMKKKNHREYVERESDRDQDSSFESKDKLKRIKSSSSLSSSLQYESPLFIKMAKKIIKKKKRGEELTDSEIIIYNKIQKKRKLEKTENNENRKLQKLKSKKDNRYISSYASNPCISAEEVITDYHIYEEFGNPENKKVKQGKFDTIKLLYPNGKYESYPLIVPKKPDELNPIEDLKYTMQMVIRYCVPQKYQNLFGDSKNGIIRSIIKSTNRKNKEGLKKAIAEYNKVLESIINDKAFVDSEEYGDVSAPELVSHILIQAYSRTVAQKSDMLNSYRGFSNNVYGEVNSNLVTEFIKNSELKPHHIFIDMGS
eukprot:jgi/Orpsp1_1/1182347/evm.model.c7180000080925.1